VHIVDNKHDLNVYLKADNKNAACSTTSCIPTPAGMDALPSDYNANEWAGKYDIVSVLFSTHQFLKLRA
jgi:hypothetical protein